MNRLSKRRLTTLIAARTLTLTLTLTSAHAASACPFDTGGSDALNDGVALTR